MILATDVEQLFKNDAAAEVYSVIINNNTL